MYEIEQENRTGGGVVLDRCDDLQKAIDRCKFFYERATADERKRNRFNVNEITEEGCDTVFTID